MVATPPEEIARQHEAAMKIVSNSGDTGNYAPMINHGEIPLDYKLQPTVENPDFMRISNTTTNTTCQGKEEEKKSTCSDCDQEETSHGAPENNNDNNNDWNGCISTRGFVNVEPLAELCREGYNEPAKPIDHTNESQSQQQSPNNTNENGTTPHDPKQKGNNPTKKKKKFTNQDVKSTTNYWDEINATVHNVSVIRPSHDKWGIKKIVFMFCDDFLQDVYVMPWWHQSDKYKFKQCIQPVLDALQVDETQIVRMLLANLPPGVTIPIHHDTGEWVQYTHRVHVPILVPQDLNTVLFRCGPTPQTMERINCQPGHVFEMNNQAKHTVSNCSTENEYRVHLILDYVNKKENDSSSNSQQLSQRHGLPRRRIPLQPGEHLLQTRRSIDRALDYGKRPTPTYMILGAQKAGTTSLYEYIHQHPLAIQPRRRETHCLDWRWNTKIDGQDVEKHRQWCLKFYFTEELQYHPSCLTGDSTPSYLIDSQRVIPRLCKVFTHYRQMKFIIMVRDPMKRCQSHYAMVTSKQGTPEQLKTRGQAQWMTKTIDEVIQEDLQLLYNHGVIPYWDVHNNCLKENGQVIWNSFCNSKEEQDAWNSYVQHCLPLHTGSYGIISRGLYALQIQSWLQYQSNNKHVFDSDQFLLLKLESYKTYGVQHIMEYVWDHLGLPSYHVQDDAPKNTRSYETTMTSSTCQFLQCFFDLHNRRLERLVKESGIRTIVANHDGNGNIEDEWKHPVWNYETKN